MRRTETPKPIWIQFCMVVDIPDIVIYTNFGDHRLRGFWVAGGQISPLCHWLWSSPLQHSFTTWKTLHNSQPLYLSELISHYLPSRSLRSSSTNLLTRPPGITSNFSSRTFSVSAPSTWNSVPAHIRSIEIRHPIHLQTPPEIPSLPVCKYDCWQIMTV